MLKATYLIMDQVDKTWDKVSKRINAGFVYYNWEEVDEAVNDVFNQLRDQIYVQSSNRRK